MHLILTEIDKNLFAHQDKHFLYLGEWVFTEEGIDLGKNSTVNQYHWNDIKKFNSDSEYIKVLQKKYFKFLYKKLNLIHGLKKSERFWKIVIGPWLNYFIEVLFDRWESINNIINQEIDSVNISANCHENFIPYEFNDFLISLNSHEVNHNLFSEIIKFRNRRGQLKIQNYKYINLNHNKKNLNRFIKKSFKHKLIKHLKFNFTYFIKKNKFLFISSGFSAKNTFKLKYLLGDFPYPDLEETFSIDSKEYNCDMREKIKKLDNDTLFEEFISEMIVKYLPFFYLENFAVARQKADTLVLPIDPKIIFISAGFSQHDSFRLYIANKIEGKCKLLIGQHGGNYGSAKIHSIEDFEIDVSDYFITWGWIKNKKTIPLSKLWNNFTIKNKNLNCKKKILFADNEIGPYSSTIRSLENSSQNTDLIKRSIKIIKKIENYENRVDIKLYPKTNYWNQKNIWKSFLPNIRFIEKIENKKIYKNYKLFISCTNTTFFLETLFHNLPTVIYFDQNISQLRDSAKSYFEILENVKILHYDYQGASNHINQVYNNAEDWWFKPDVQKARELFCLKFAKKNDNEINDLSNFINSILI